MSDLFRLEAIDGFARRYGSAIRVGQSSFWAWTAILFLIVIIALGILFFYRYPQWEMQGGITIYQNPPTIVYAPYRSVVRRILVEDGDEVFAGDPLIEVRIPVASDNSINPLERQRSMLSEVSRSKRAAGQVVVEQIDSSIEMIRRRSALISAQIASTNREIESQRKEESRLGAFLKKIKQPEFQEVLPRVQVLDYESRLTGVRSTLTSLERQLLELRASDLSLMEEEAKAAANRAVALSESEVFLAQQEAQRISHIMENGGVIHAPTSGVVVNVVDHPHGEVDASQPLLSIFSSYEIIGIMMATGDQAAFLKPGDTIRLRFDAWNFRTNGEVVGIIRSVAKAPIVEDAHQTHGDSKEAPHYPVEIAISQQSFESVADEHHLLAGMRFQGVIIKDRAPLVEKLFSAKRKSSQDREKDAGA